MPLVRLTKNREISLRRYGNTIVIRDMQSTTAWDEEIHISVAAFKELQKFKIKDIPE